MLHHELVLRRATLAKFAETDNMQNRRKSRLLRMMSLRYILDLVAAMALFAGATAAHAVPTLISWETPLQKGAAHRLEVSQDADFKNILFAKDVSGTSEKWVTPREGVFHWRIQKSAKKAMPTTFVSGSFVVVDGAVTRTRSARIDWKREQGAERYKLYVTEPSGKLSVITTSSPSYALGKTPRTMTIEAVPQSTSPRIFGQYHFIPSLSFDPGVSGSETKAATPMAIAATPSKVKEAPLAPVEEKAKPEDKTPKKLEPIAAAPTEKSAPRAHEVKIYNKYLNSSFTTQKLELKWESDETEQGLGLSIWSKPIPALVLSGAAEYYEHDGYANRKELRRAGASRKAARTSIDEIFYHVWGTVGLDVLGLAGFTNQSLSLGVGGAIAQFSTLPLSLAYDPLDPPTLKSRQLEAPGGGLAYAYLGDLISFDVGGEYFADADEQMTQGRLGLSLQPGDLLSAHIFFYARDMQSVRCHSTRTICLNEGKVKTSISEQGIAVGLGATLH